MGKKSNTFGLFLERFSHKVTQWAGSSWAFAAAVTVIVIWGVTGPIFGFSDTWQLVINTGTTIVTFLMVFLIPAQPQNKDPGRSSKLNEMVAALEGASNRLIDVEDLTEDEIETLYQHYRRLVVMAKKDSLLTKSHSVEEAELRHRAKLERSSD